MAKQYHLPTSYTEVYEHYYPMMIRMVSEAKIDYQDVPDVAMELLTTFIAKDGLTFFDPTRVTQPGTEGRLFHAMLKGFTGVYVRKYQDRQRRDAQRIYKMSPEQIVGDAPLSDDVDCQAYPALAKAAGLISEVSIEAVLESRSIAANITDALFLLKQIHPKYNWDLFLESVTDRALDGRILSHAWLAEQLNVSSKTAKRMLVLFQDAYLAIDVEGVA
jgi:hypothetical protein